MHFKQVILFFQVVRHPFLPSAELVVGKEEFLTIQFHFGVGIKTLKNQLNTILFQHFLIHIEVQGVVPRMVGNPEQLVFHRAEIGMRNDAVFVEALLHHRGHIDLHINI